MARVLSVVVFAILGGAGVRADADSPWSVRTAAVAADGRSVRIVLADGRTTSVAADDVRESFGPPRIASDRHLVGWAERRSEGASYAYPVALHLISNGITHVAVCSSGFPWTWRFVSADRVGLRCEPLHGAGTRSLQLVDIATGTIVQRIALSGDDDALPRTAPAWTRATFAP